VSGTGERGCNDDFERDRQKAIAQLQAEITKGIESGPPEPFEVVSFKLKMRENGQAILNRIML
jgi:hypothetical protein